MIRGVFIVSSSGSLAGYSIKSSGAGDKVNVDKVIGLASTIYTAIEILNENKMYGDAERYRKTVLVFERGAITVFRTATRMLFAVLHDVADEKKKIEEKIERMHGEYVEKILYNPTYSVGDHIDFSVFNEVFG
ncbi:trafficking protein particle complex subunit 2 [Nematocida sp. LUAm3]|nr:trafficking protein particle complex subunit 2 [Nematocida sp. LUAm3]KAI5174785.1 trafficking protein particle complex subunit 2 [Nematocida sp. LUAm2]KAI5177804.1 trafficking protein particle complex subunit 2 [Nematocida sp. LUAm1]